MTNKKFMRGTNSVHHRWQSRWYGVLNRLFQLCVIAILVGCNSQSEAGAEPTIPGPAPALENTAIAQTSLGPGLPQNETLVVWTPPFFSPWQEGPAGTALQQAFDSFEGMHPQARLEIHLAAESGATGVYNYLRTAATAAPSVLPDLVLIDTQQMWRVAADFDLLVPLSPDEVNLMLDNAYPFTQDAVTFNEQIYGVPYVASIVHMAYYRASLQNNGSMFPPPASWSSLFDSGKSYVFPAAGQNGLSNEMLLLQYVGAGGQLRADGSVSNTEALTALLNFIASGMENGLFPRENLEISTYGAALEAFIARESDFVNISSEQFLEVRNSLANIDFAVVPTRSESTVTIGRVWAFVILTQDPTKRLLALQLIEHLLDPQRHASWTESAQRLPTHMIAFSSWSEQQPYYDFLRQQMDVALAVPNGPAFATFSQQLQSAQQKVINAELSIQGAINQIIGGQ